MHLRKKNRKKLEALRERRPPWPRQIITLTMGIENYIKYNLSSSERSAMAQFRFGILPLNIETGRFRNQALEKTLYSM